MSWSDVEIPQFSIVEKSKPCISFNTGYVTNVTFSEDGSNCSIFKQPLENRPNELRCMSSIKGFSMQFH